MRVGQDEDPRYGLHRDLLPGLRPVAWRGGALSPQDGKRPVVAIDGPSGAGKSTVARAVARALGYTYVDTGAMYRAVAVEADRLEIRPENAGALASFLERIDLRIDSTADPARVFVGGREVTGEIRTPQASMLASAYSAVPAVRARLTRLQREMGLAGAVVLEGRDIGTVVFPDADVKVYLDASPAERARRRAEQLRQLGREVDHTATLREIEKRDRDDSTREHAPLSIALGARVLDTTGLSLEDVISEVLAEVGKALARR